MAIFKQFVPENNLQAHLFGVFQEGKKFFL